MDEGNKVVNLLIFLVPPVVFLIFSIWMQVKIRQALPKVVKINYKCKKLLLYNHYSLYFMTILLIFTSYTIQIFIQGIPVNGVKIGKMGWFVYLQVFN